VFILEHHFTSKSFVAAGEEFSNTHPDQELPRRQQHADCSNISGHRKCLSVTSAHRATEQLRLSPYRFQAVHQLQQKDAAASIQYRHWLSFLCVAVGGWVLSGTSCIYNRNRYT
jgi:hypothetical protein